MRCIAGLPSLPIQYDWDGDSLSLKALILPVDWRCGPRQKSTKAPMV